MEEPLSQQEVFELNPQKFYVFVSQFHRIFHLCEVYESYDKERPLILNLSQLVPYNSLYY